MIDSAFPNGIFTDDKGKIIGGQHGMTLLDYFAAKAMQSLVSNYSKTNCPDEIIAQDSYALAGAMMNTRRKYDHE